MKIENAALSALKPQPPAPENALELYEQQIKTLCDRTH